MQHSHNTIQHLPEAVVQRSRASVHITDFAVAVAELVQNAVDAGSRLVNVTVSTKDWSVSVTDDGHGITAASMQLLGQRCCTSKLAPARGEALSCLAQVSSLRITSRAQGAFETYTKALGTATNTTLQLCTTPRQRHGTTVTLTNFLRSQPVRRQQSKGHAAELEDVKTALHAVMLPHPAVELSMQQAGSCALVLHMPKDRDLPSSCKQLFQHVQDHTFYCSTSHKQGWKLTGCVAAPPATFQSANQQLLYLNKRPITCSVLQQLLRDWFVRSLRGYQANPDNHCSRNASLRAPEPGYVLLITCPASGVVLQSRTALHAEADFSASMGQLVEQLQEGIGPAWGTMPPAWRAVAAPQHSKKSAGGPLSMRSSVCGGGRSGAPAAIKPVDVVGAGSGQQRSQLQTKQAQLQPVHGLQLASRTRSLAGRAADMQDDCGDYQQHNTTKVHRHRHSNEQQQQQVERKQYGAWDTCDNSRNRPRAVDVPPEAGASAKVADAECAPGRISNLQDVPAHLHTAHINTAWMGSSSSPVQHVTASAQATGRRRTAAAATAAVAASAPAEHDSLASPVLLESGLCGGEVSANTAAAVIAAAVAAATPKKATVPGTDHTLTDWLEDDFCTAQDCVRAPARLLQNSPTLSLSDMLADDLVAVSHPAALLSQHTQQQRERQQQQQTALQQQRQHNTSSTGLSVDRCGMSPLDSAGELACSAYRSPTQQQCSWLLAADYSPSFRMSPKAAAATEQAVAAGLLEDDHCANMHADAGLKYDSSVPSPAYVDQHYFWNGGDTHHRQPVEERTMLWENSHQQALGKYKLCSPAALDNNCNQKQAASPGDSAFHVSPLLHHRPRAVAGLDSPSSPVFSTAFELQELQQRKNQHIQPKMHQQQDYMDLLGSTRQQPGAIIVNRSWGLDTHPQQVSAKQQQQQQQQLLLLTGYDDCGSWQQQQQQHGQQVMQQQDDEDTCLQQQYQQVFVAYSSRHNNLDLAADFDLEHRCAAGYNAAANLSPLLASNSYQPLQLLQQQDAAPVHHLLNGRICQSGTADAIATNHNTTLLQNKEELEELEELFLHHSSTVAAIQQHQQQQLNAGSLAAGAGISQDCWGLGAAGCHARAALQGQRQQQEQQQQQQQQCEGVEDFVWYQQQQPYTATAPLAKGLHAIQCLQKEAFSGFGAGDTPPRSAVHCMRPSFGPSPVVHRRRRSGSGAGNNAGSVLGSLQQLLASPLEFEYGTLPETQAATAGPGPQARETAAAQECVASGLFGQQKSCRKGVGSFNYKGQDYWQQEQPPPNYQHCQQQHRQLRVVAPAQSEETVQQQHGQNADQSGLLQPSVKSVKATTGNCPQLGNQQQQHWTQRTNHVTRARHPAPVQDPVEVSGATSMATAAAAASAPLLQPFHERLLRSASPQCKRPRKFAVSDALAAAPHSIDQRRVRQLQLEGDGGSMLHATPTDAAVAAGDSSKDGRRLPASCTQQVGDAAAQAAAGSDAPDAEQPLQDVDIGSAVDAGCKAQEAPKIGRAALHDVTSNIANTVPDVANAEAAPKQCSNPSKTDASNNTRAREADACERPAVTATHVAAGSDAAAADLGGEPSYAWQQMQQRWKQQQHNPSKQKRRKLSADKVGPQDAPSKQLQQSKLHFLPLASARPAEKTAGEAGIAADMQGPQPAKARQLVQAADNPADVTAGAAAATASVADTNRAAERAPAPVAAAQPVVASVSAMKLRSSLAKPKPAAAVQLQTSPTCDGVVPQPGKPRKRVSFSDIPMSGSSEEQPRCETAQQQQHCNGQQRDPSTNITVAGQHQAEAHTAQSYPAAACNKTQAPGGRTSPYFPSIHPHKQTSSFAGGCSRVSGQGGGLLWSPALAYATVTPPAILSIDDLCRGSSSSTTALVPDSVTRQQLQHAHILTQVDNKMIVARCGVVLLAIDQHAADERVQLEALQHKLALQLHQQNPPQSQQQQQPQSLGVGLSAISAHAGLSSAVKADAADGTNSSSTSALPLPTIQPRLLQDGGMLLQMRRLTPAVSMLLSMAEAKALVQYRQQVEAWGWKVLLHDSKGGAAAGQATGVTTAALLQQAPVLSGVQLGALDMQMYLHQLLETCGSAQQPPPGVVRTLKSKACRSAIMFGMTLSQQRCVELVQQLGTTQLCFCCAHGRPTMAPLVELAALAARTKQQSAARSLAQAAAEAAAAEGCHGLTTMQCLTHKLRKLVKRSNSCCRTRADSE